MSTLHTNSRDCYYSIPCVTQLEGQNGVYDDFELSNDYGKATRLNARNMPIVLSFSKVSHIRMLIRLAH
jgi:hypothetical protein